MARGDVRKVSCLVIVDILFFFMSHDVLILVFFSRAGELVARGDVRTVCLAADLLSRLYALCLSCGPQVY